MNSVKWQSVLRTSVKVGRRRAFMLYGDTGIGKTESTEHAFDDMLCPKCGEHKVPVVTRHLAEMMPEDIRGILVFDPTDKSLRWHNNPDWRIGYKCPVVYFLDEYNQAERPVRKAAMEFTTKFSIGGTSLPEGSVIVLAGNEAEHGADVDELMRPEKSRLTHIKFDFDFEAWTSWGWKNGMHPYVMSYANAKPGAIYKPDHKQKYGEQLPRNWWAVSEDLKNYPESEWDELVAGEIGEGAALEFMAWVQTAGKLMPIVERILSGENVAPDELSAQFFVCGVLVDRFSKKKSLSERLCSYAVSVADKNPEAASVMLRDAGKVDKKAIVSSPSWKRAVDRLKDYLV